MLTGGGFDRTCWAARTGDMRMYKELLCAKDDDIRVAYKRAGEPCSEDAPKPQPISAPNAAWLDPNAVTLDRRDLCSHVDSRHGDRVPALCRNPLGR